MKNLEVQTNTFVVNACIQRKFQFCTLNLLVSIWHLLKSSLFLLVPFLVEMNYVTSVYSLVNNIYHM